MKEEGRKYYMKKERKEGRTISRRAGLYEGRKGGLYKGRRIV